MCVRVIARLLQRLKSKFKKNLFNWPLAPSCPLAGEKISKTLILAVEANRIASPNRTFFRILAHYGQLAGVCNATQNGQQKEKECECPPACA